MFGMGVFDSKIENFKLMRGLHSERNRNFDYDFEFTPDFVVELEDRLDMLNIGMQTSSSLSAYGFDGVVSFAGLPDIMSDYSKMYKATAGKEEFSLKELSTKELVDYIDIILSEEAFRKALNNGSAGSMRRVTTESYRKAQKAVYDEHFKLIDDINIQFEKYDIPLVFTKEKGELEKLTREELARRKKMRNSKVRTFISSIFSRKC